MSLLLLFTGAGLGSPTPVVDLSICQTSMRSLIPGRTVAARMPSRGVRGLQATRAVSTSMPRRQVRSHCEDES